MEFALVAPLFFLLVFGLLEVGRLLMVQHAITNAAQVGCRKAILATTLDDADVETAVANHLRSGMVGNAPVTVNVQPDLATVTSGTEVSVNVSMNYSDLTWLPNSFISAVVQFEAVQDRE